MRHALPHPRTLVGLLALLATACAGPSTRTDLRSALVPAPSVLSTGPLDFYATMVVDPATESFLELEEPEELGAAAAIHAEGDARLVADGSYQSRTFVLENTGDVPLTYLSYGPPLEGRASLTPNSLLVGDDGAEEPFTVGWCGTGLEPHELAPGSSLRFEAGMHVEPDGTSPAYRVTVALSDPDGASLEVRGPVVRAE